MGIWLGLLAAVFVFGGVVALVMAISNIATGSAAQRLKLRLLALKDVDENEQSGSVIRARYLRQLPPLERWLEELPVIRDVGRLSEQAGRTTPAYRIIVAGIVVAIVAGTVVGVFFGKWWLGLIAALAGGAAPFMKLMSDRSERLAKFEQQLPDALDLMTRAMRAGNPLLESFKFCAEEMQPPISTDFERAWSNINYGVSLKASLQDLVTRTPSMSLRAMITAILVQRETGGNLAEVLDKITEVLRGRAKFQRRLKTLTAEGRVSAYVLIGMPFGLSALLSVSSPQYLPILFQDPAGLKLVGFAVAMMATGIFWITRIVKIRV